MNLKEIDLNLLIALNALLSTGSVTGAARQIGITQPAMSNALRRMRDIFGDPIFLKHGRSLTPTAWAVSLRPVLEGALRDLESLLDVEREFQPARAHATLTIAISDYWQFVLLPRLVRRLETEAPGVRLQVTSVGESVLTHDLAVGAVNAAIFLAPRAFLGLHCETFVTDTYACVVRRRHPLGGRPLTLEGLATHRQVVVTPRGPWEERLKEAMHRRGIDTELALLTPYHHVALDIVTQTDYFAVVPRQVALHARLTRPLHILEPPVPLGQFSLGLYWHGSTDTSPLHRWFRGLLVAEARVAYFGERARPQSAVAGATARLRRARPAPRPSRDA